MKLLLCKNPTKNCVSKPNFEQNVINHASSTKHFPHRRSNKKQRQPNRKIRKHSSNKKLREPNAEQKCNHASSTKYSPHRHSNEKLQKTNRKPHLDSATPTKTAHEDKRLTKTKTLTTQAQQSISPSPPPLKQKNRESPTGKPQHNHPTKNAQAQR
jgi:hypothetical protein